MSDRQFVTSTASRLRLTGVALACVACAFLSACSTVNRATGSVTNWVIPYKIEVVQGNFVSKEQKEALQVGMPRAQVRDILGSPMVTSVFHEDRWDYVFSLRRQGQPPQQRKLSVFFKGDELTKVESDELPSEQEFVSSLSEGRRVGKPALLEVPESVLVEFGLKNAVPAAGVVAPNTAARPATSYPPLEAPGTRASAWDASTLLASGNAPASTATPANANSAASSLSAAVAQAPVLAPRPAAPAVAVAPVATAPAGAPSVSPAPAPAPAPATPATPATAAAPVAAAAASPALPPAPAAPVASAGAPVTDPGITELLNRWSSAWQARNVNDYFSHYVPDFKGNLNTRADWEAQRRSRIEGRTRISLSIQDVRVRMDSPTEARLVFRQDYASDAFREIGTKAMFLVKRDGRWLIEREFFTPLSQ